MRKIVSIFFKVPEREPHHQEIDGYGDAVYRNGSEHAAQTHAKCCMQQQHLKQVVAQMRQSESDSPCDRRTGFERKQRGQRKVGRETHGITHGISNSCIDDLLQQAIYRIMNSRGGNSDDSESEKFIDYLSGNLATHNPLRYLHKHERSMYGKYAITLFPSVEVALPASYINLKPQQRGPYRHRCCMILTRTLS